MNREKRLLSSGRFNALTRKQQLRDAQARNNATLADEVAKRLEPFIRAEIARQLDEVFSGTE
jgi:hypothetical protein